MIERNSVAAVRVEHIVSQIVTRLFRVSNGKGHTTGNRIAVKVGEWPNEQELGGWCKEAAAREIRKVLANAERSNPADSAGGAQGKDSNEN